MALFFPLVYEFKVYLTPEILMHSKFYFSAEMHLVPCERAFLFRAAGQEETSLFETKFTCLFSPRLALFSPQGVVVVIPFPLTGYTGH